MKTVIVTGGSRGIGKAIVYAFANAGYNVILNYNNSEQSAKNIVEDLKDCKGIVEMVRADVSSRDQVDAMIEYVNKEFGGIDVIVNNAGVSHVGLFDETTEEEFRKVIDVNLMGVFNVTQSALKECMLSKKDGCIINISSVWGISGASCEVAYSASKAGVIGLTKGLAKELAPSNITVNAIAPGAIATDMMYKEYTEKEISEIEKDIPMGRLGTPVEVANLALYLASENARYITGQVISPNGGMVI